MEQMKTAVLSACMLSAAVGIISLIRPGKALERQIRFLVSILFVICLAAPVMQIEFPSDLGVFAEEQAQQHEEMLTAGMEEQLLKEVTHCTEQALIEKLASEGISCTKMKATLYIDEEECIYCSDIEAECDDFAGACAVLEEVLGEEVNIRVTEVLS